MPSLNNNHNQKVPGGKLPELLAPAGSPEGVRTALRFGADACYIGGPMLQLRANGVGFSEKNLAEAVTLAHSMQKKLYVTVNSFARSEEISQIPRYAAFLAETGVDAAIISDLGVLTAFHTACPDLEIHLSTQANCCNYLSARVWHEMGARRIVLARELTLEEIAEIRAKTPSTLELEAFAHGAMCMAYSGRCLLSSYMTGRSGNRGECAQPCRWSYALSEEKRPGEYYPVEEEGGATAILSSHDLCTIDFLPEMCAAGIASLKIEGRMKTPYYVATVTRAYRRRLAGADPIACRAELDAVSHRPYSSGFYFGHEAVHPTNDGLYRQTKKIAATILARDPLSGRITVEMRNPFAAGDSLELLSPGEDVSFRVEELTDAEGTPVEKAIHPKGIYHLSCPFPCEAGDMLRSGQ